MKIGIIGLPNAGKSTIFNALTGGNAGCAPYAFTTIEPNVGMAAIYDKRVSKIAALLNLKKEVYGNIKFVDIAGLVKGASKGEGLGNQFLSEVRAMDALMHVVRSFTDINVPRPAESTTPEEDIELINLELILSDLELVERRLGKNLTKARSGIADARRETDILVKIRDCFLRNIPLRSQALKPDETEFAGTLDLLTGLPVLYVINVDESWKELEKPLGSLSSELKASEGAETIILAGGLEAELTGLDEKEKILFLKDAGFDTPGLERIIQAGKRLLDLITFFTTESNECRAWLVRKGTKAVEAAAEIHTDMADGFIKAEIVAFEDLLSCGSLAAARESGHYLIEGREYLVKDGDIVLFRFRK